MMKSLIYFLFRIIMQPRYFIVIWVFYEYMLAKQRESRFAAACIAALKRARTSGKGVLLLGEKPDDWDDHGVNTLHIESHDLLYKDVLRNEDYIILESFIFENMDTDTFEKVKNTLRMRSPKDLFLVHMQPYSLFAWIHQWRTCKIHDIPTCRTVPNRVFLFYPPTYNFVYTVDNPFKRYERYAVHGLTVAAVLCTLLSLWN